MEKLFLCLFAALVLFAGCSSPPETEAPVTSPPVTEAPTEVPTEPPEQIEQANDEENVVADDVDADDTELEPAETLPEIQPGKLLEEYFTVAMSLAPDAISAEIESLSNSDVFETVDTDQIRDFAVQYNNTRLHMLVDYSSNVRMVVAAIDRNEVGAEYYIAALASSLGSITGEAALTEITSLIADADTQIYQDAELILSINELGNDHFFILLAQSDEYGSDSFYSEHVDDLGLSLTMFATLGV